MRTRTLRFGAVLASALALPAAAQEGTFVVRSMTPETATAAAQAALEHCRKNGFQVAVAVVDRSGVLQAFVRDRLAGPHTVEVATHKAWTAASFKVATAVLATETQAGRPLSGLRSLPRVIAVGGGLPMEVGGALLGAIGVSGAPVGDADEACAKAGLRAVADALEF